MDDFQTKVLSGIEELKIKVAVIESKVNNDLESTKIKADESYMMSSQNKIDVAKIEDKIKWITRTIGAAIISGIIAFLFAYFKK